MDSDKEHQSHLTEIRDAVRELAQESSRIREFFD
jgi:hypothetical protein